MQAKWIVVALALMLLAFAAGFGLSYWLFHTTVLDQHPVKNVPDDNQFDEPYYNYRLNQHIRPELYQIHLTIDPVTGDYWGNVTISINIHNDLAPNTSQLRLHSNGLIIDMDKTTLTDNEPKCQFYNHENEYFVIELAKPLRPGLARLGLSFNGNGVGKVKGLYQGHYTFEGEEHYLMATKLEPTYAREVLPCFDEPAMKAKFTVIVTHPIKYTGTISNMPMISQTIDEQLDENGVQWVTSTFDTTVPMSTYLLAIVVSEFDYLEKVSTNGVKVRVFSRPPYLDSSKLSLDIGANMVDYYSEYFDQKYEDNFPKIDFVALPQFQSGAMENWGLVTFREIRMWYNETSSHPQFQLSVGEVVCHELAHMWFGNTVTMKWWDDLWLNEGFATYFSFVHGMAVYNDADWSSDTTFLTEELLPGLLLDSLPSSHPIRMKVEKPHEIVAVFDKVTYAKGASILRMLNNFLGDDLMRRGMQVYLARHKFGNTVTEDLWEALSSESDQNVAELMENWSRKTGFPSLEYDSKTNTVRQRRFLLVHHQANEIEIDNSVIWQIPIIYRCLTKSGEWLSHRMLLTKNSDTLDDTCNNAQLIKLNTNFTGFFVVQYDQPTWRGLIKAIMKNATMFSPQDRINLLSDAHTSAMEGVIPLNTTLDLLQYAPQERHWNFWELLRNILNNYRIRLHCLQEPDIDNSAAHKFRQMEHNLITSLLRELLVEKPGANFREKMLRTRVLELAMNTAHPVFVKHAMPEFDSFIYNNTELPSLTKDLILSAGIYERGNDDHVWSYCVAQFNAAQTQDEQRQWAQALATVRNSTKIRMLLRESWEQKAKKNLHDEWLQTLLPSVSRKDLIFRGEFVAWKYLKENYKEINAKFGKTDRYFGMALDLTAQFFDTRTQLQEVEQLMREYPDAGAGERTRRQLIDKIKFNIWFRDYRLPQLIEWVNQNVKQIGR